MQLPLLFNSLGLKATLEKIFSLSQKTSSTLNPSHKLKFNQYFTEGNVAKRLARRLSCNQKVIGDHGAGTGILGATAICSFLERHSDNLPNELRSYEIDTSLHSSFHECMAIVNAFAQCELQYSLGGDFLSACDDVLAKRRNSLSCAILNPPYKKLSQSDPIALYLKNNFCPAPNNYAAFIILTVDMLEPFGELVAIVPRSFTSGSYFKKFRQWLRESGSFEWFHRYESRSNVFRNQNLLQENILFKYRKGAEQSKLVQVSSSIDPDTADSFSHSLEQSIIFPTNAHGQFTIPSSKNEIDSTINNNLKPFSLLNFGLSISTGKFEDCRNKESLTYSNIPDSYPVIYPQHWKDNQPFLEWHINTGKPCFAYRNEMLAKKVIPRGNYILIKRISANDLDTRRCVATILSYDSDIPGNKWLIDNHIQVIGVGSYMSEDLAMKIHHTLSSDTADGVFRAISGTTQLNKEDISAIRYN